jgi:hypothetical protein
MRMETIWTSRRLPGQVDSRAATVSRFNFRNAAQSPVSAPEHLKSLHADTLWLFITNAIVFSPFGSPSALREKKFGRIVNIGSVNGQPGQYAR